MSSISNISTSIHQRLLNKAEVDGRAFNELLQYYAIERFLYRLGQTPYNQRFVLKGALVFLAWQVPLTRPTRDIDFLGFTENSVDNLVRIIQKICVQSVEPDGLTFDPESIKGEIIKEEADYRGIRIKFLGFLGKAKINMRLDIGFADVITPAVSELEIPTILEGSSRPCIQAYPPETVVAEKFQAIVALGMVNSRMKDYYDLWYMANSMQFDLFLLQEAISNTFLNRKTVIPKEVPSALLNEFAIQKQTQWYGFLKKSQINNAPQSLIEVMEKLRLFFNPIIRYKGTSTMCWMPTIGWTGKSVR